MVFLRKIFSYACMVAIFGAFLAPADVKSMRKEGSGNTVKLTQLRVGLGGGLGCVQDFPKVLSGKLEKIGIEPVFYYIGNSIPEGVDEKLVKLYPQNVKPGKGADIYFYLNSYSDTPLVNNSLVVDHMKQLVKFSTTGSAIHIQLVSSMCLEQHVEILKGLKIRDCSLDKGKKPEEKFRSVIFYGDSKRRKFDDVFLGMSQGKLFIDAPSCKGQMKQLVELLRKVAGSKKPKDLDEPERIEYLEQNKKLPQIEKTGMGTIKILLPKSKVWQEL